MKLTINEIAEMAQVAKSTVSKALNGQKGVSEENRKRILNIVRQVNFQPNSAARALAQNKTGTIGFVLPHEAAFSLSGVYWAGIVTAVAAEVSKRGGNLMVITPSEDAENPFASLESIIRRRIVDGLIIGAEQLDTKSMMSILMEDIPFVFIGRNAVLQHYCVDVNNTEGAAAVVSQLINHGYKHIACITGPADYLYTQDRITGFTDAMNAANLDGTRIVHTSYLEEDTRKNTAKLTERYPDTDALFITAGGEFVLTILETLRLSGISLRGFGFGVFDDSRIFDFLDFPIITAKQPIKRLGSTAAQLLFDLIEGTPPAQTVCWLPVDIVLR